MSEQTGKSTFRVFALALAGVLFVAAGEGHDAAYAASGIKIENPHLRVTIPGRPAAGYMTVRNAGGAADTIVSVSSPLAKRIELHTHLMEGGVMKMRQIEELEVPTNGTAEFKPGGNHLMVFGVDESVTPGDAISVTVTFEKAGAIEVEFLVKSIKGSPYAKSGAHTDYGGDQHNH